MIFLHLHLYIKAFKANIAWIEAFALQVLERILISLDFQSLMSINFRFRTLLFLFCKSQEQMEWYGA